MNDEGQGEGLGKTQERQREGGGEAEAGQREGNERVMGAPFVPGGEH